MASTRLLFTLAGRDELSRVLNGTASSADRLRLRLAGMTQDADGNLRDLQGRLLDVDDAQRRLTDGNRRTTADFDALKTSAGKLGEALKANLISLAPAAIPASAALAGAAAQVAAQFGAVAVAAAAYGLALGPQISAIGEAVKAQEKYDDAVRTSGKGSAEAVKAAGELQQQMAKMPPATQRAAVAVGLLKDEYQEWSNSLAGDVMGPFIKGVAVANTLLPKTTGLVKASSAQFDRLVTLLGGAISTPGFDRLVQRFTEYSDKTMTRAVSSTTEFLAKLDTGEVGGGLRQFMDYARANGPAVWDTLENVGEALLHVLQAGSDVGVGMLDVVNALSGIVSAVPPDAIAMLLQLAIAIKAVRLASAGAAAAGAAMQVLGAQVASMAAAAAAAPGPLRAATAAIGALSRGAKLAVAGTGIGLLLIGISALSDMGQEAAPDVDKLTTSIGELGRTGRTSGEAVRAYGKDLGGLADSLRTLARPSNAEGVQQWLTKLIGMDSTPVKRAKEDLDAVDKALSNLVSQGKGDVAAAAFDKIAAAMRKQGMSSKELRAQLDDYKSALAGQRLEQELTAQSMGVFGQQAIAVQQKLNAQKASADGLRQSINALNDANRSAYDAQISFEASVDALTESFKTNGATLDLNTESGRKNGQAMSAAAKAHDEMLASGMAAGESLGSMTKKSDQLRSTMVRLATQTGMTDQQARQYVNTLIGVPGDVKTAVRLERQDALNGLVDVQEAIRKTPGAKSVKVSTLNAAAIKALEAVGLKTRQLPDGRTEVYTKNGQALGSIGAVQRAINNLQSKTITLTTIQRYVTMGKRQPGPWADGNTGFASGGLIRGYASGGSIAGFPGGGRIRGPGTGTSDSVPIWASNGEYMIKASSVARYGLKFMDALNAGQLPTAAAGRPAAPGRAAAPVFTPTPSSSGPRVTYNVYPRSSVIDARDLQLIQRQEEARQRVGRPR